MHISIFFNLITLELLENSPHGIFLDICLCYRTPLWITMKDCNKQKPEMKPNVSLLSREKEIDAGWKNEKY